MSRKSLEQLPGIFAVLLLVSACVPAPSSPPTPNPDLGVTAQPPSGSTPTPGSAPASTHTSTDEFDLKPFGTVEIGPSETAFEVDGSGSNVDSIAFWEAPEPDGSLMFVTSKGNASIEVYLYPFRSESGTLSCGDETNGVWVDQGRDVLYITERDSSNVCAFDLPGLQPNPSLSFTTAATGGDSEPNLAMLHLPDGGSRVYVSYDDWVFFHDAGTTEPLGTFNPSRSLETMYGDDFYQLLYIPDENDRSGVYLYDLDGLPAGEKFGDRSIFQSDAEGISVYKCLTGDGEDSGEGLVVIADQREELTDFEAFDRRTKIYLGAIHISGVNNTDGLGITQQASPEYPLGLLAVIDDDTSTVGVGWDVILEKTGLSCGI